MRAGTLRDLISLLANQPSNDPRWGSTPGWSGFASEWANVVPLAGTQAGIETADAQGVQSETNFTVTLRYRDDVDSTDRILYRGQTLEIVSVADPDGRQRTLVIQARLFTGEVA